MVENLSYETKNGWNRISGEEKEKIFSFAEGYIEYLNEGKTERLACREAVRMAKEAGFCDIAEKESLSVGDKVYMVNRDKSVYLAVIGEEDILNGIRFVIAHIDSPRLDLKQNPLYEDSDMTLFKTHYYGGIKKYQWTAVPLALSGVVYKSNGEKVEVRIGDQPGDPVFCVTDLLPHLADGQMQKKATQIVEGENLNILIGSLPKAVDEKDEFKTAMLELLYEKYGICEEDFISAELEAFPAQAATDVGFDRSMVGSYGQDDRVCAYTALKAILETKSCKQTSVCVLVDKEEIGSMGNTGMRSAFFEYITASLIEKLKGNYNELMLKKVFRNSKCLSSDVNAAVDPNYPDVNEKKNASFLGRGIVMTKYTGSRGKSGTSDANAEFVYEVRKMFNDHHIIWQSSELGKVDAGGGGTIAQYVANLDVDVIDCGVALLSMHAPFEIASKLDVYMAYRAYLAFYQK
ncbi:MAG: aminopeptidase [Clostridia bacterium]|nr:aminopeptidase [Clostridia bacterium]